MAIGDHIQTEVNDALGASRDRTPLDPAAATRARLRSARAREVDPAELGGAPAIEMPIVPRRERPGNRKPFGSREQQLAYPPIEGFRLYWFNDTPGRIARAMEAGYEHVTDRKGENVNRVVGTMEGRPNGLIAYLMKIPIEWYQEDMDDQQADLADRLAEIRKGRTNVENSYVGSNHRVQTR